MDLIYSHYAYEKILQDQMNTSKKEIKEIKPIIVPQIIRHNKGALKTCYKCGQPKIWCSCKICPS